MHNTGLTWVQQQKMRHFLLFYWLRMPTLYSCNLTFYVSLGLCPKFLRSVCMRWVPDMLVYRVYALMEKITSWLIPALCFQCAKPLITKRLTLKPLCTEPVDAHQYRFPSFYLHTCNYAYMPFFKSPENL